MKSRLTAYIDQELHKKIKQIAHDKYGVSISALIEVVLEELIIRESREMDEN